MLIDDYIYTRQLGVNGSKTDDVKSIVVGYLVSNNYENNTIVTLSSKYVDDQFEVKSSPSSGSLQ